MTNTGYPLCAGEVPEFDSKTGRRFETGSGALSHAEQAALFAREAAIAADIMPKPGERCPKTGREYEVGSGAWPKTRQTARFLEEQAVQSGR
jgi:hypothetical protein